MNRQFLIPLSIISISVAVLTSASSSALPPDAISVDLRPVVHVTGEVGKPYILQFSESLDSTSWNVATNFLMPPGGFDFFVPKGLPTPQQFYRAIPGTVLASSAADFSGVQGSNNWFYGYYPSPFASTNFVEFDNFTGETWKTAGLNVWTEVRQIDQHPNGTTTGLGRLGIEQWAVRRWRSPVTQTINLSVFIRDRTTGNGNGVIAHVFLDGVEKGTYPIDDGGQRWESLTLDVQAGSLLDFVVDPRDSNDWCDSTEVRAVIY